MDMSGRPLQLVLTLTVTKRKNALLRKKKFKKMQLTKEKKKRTPILSLNQTRSHMLPKLWKKRVNMTEQCNLPKTILMATMIPIVASAMTNLRVLELRTTLTLHHFFLYRERRIQLLANRLAGSLWIPKEIL